NSRHHCRSSACFSVLFAACIHAKLRQSRDLATRSAGAEEELPAGQRNIGTLSHFSLPKPGTAKIETTETGTDAGQTRAGAQPHASGWAGEGASAGASRKIAAPPLKLVSASAARTTAAAVHELRSSGKCAWFTYCQPVQYEPSSC